jgi:hypothetical protein
MMFFAQNTAKNKIGKLKMAKLMFALDFEHFRQTGRTVTDLNYFAYQNDPYPKELMNKMSEKEFPDDLSKDLTLILKGDT